MENPGIRSVSWTISAKDAAEFTLSADGSRTPLCVERFLRAKGCSHHVLTLLKRTDHGILLNGTWAYGNQPVKPGDEITIHVEEASASEQILPISLPLSIVYEDEDVLVVDKPASMPVHPSMGNYENTLANAVMYYYSSKGIPFVFRCVTRLDRDTTGLVLLAKNSLSSAILSDRSAHRQIHREYLAIVEGELPENGTIDAPIVRCEGSVLMRRVDPENGERAVTHFKRLALGWRNELTKRPAPTQPNGLTKGSAPGQPNDLTKRPTSGQPNDLTKRPTPGQPNEPAAQHQALPDVISLASIRLETGRTHQIRVHMKSIGHPLPGDFLYNPDSVCALAPRQTLHSHRLTFAHPITGEPLSFVSELPADMRNLLKIYKCELPLI